MFEQQSSGLHKGRFVVMLTLVLVMIVASVVALVLVDRGGSNSKGTAAGVAAPPGAGATSSDVNAAPTGSSATSSASSTTPSVSSTPVAASAAPRRSTGSGTPAKTSRSSAAPAPSETMSPVANTTKTTPRPPLTYTVKRGDNLFVIARWFKLHGYGDLYQRNMAVIGANPDLILPGQKITLTDDGLMTSSK